MYCNFIITKYNIGDVYWCDLVETIYEYMTINWCKFRLFSTIVKCTIDNEDISILFGEVEGYFPYNKIDENIEEWLHNKYLDRYKIRHYIKFHSGLIDIVLHSSTVLSKVTIIFFSNYKSMTVKHKTQQPRRVLESKIIKHKKRKR